MEELVPCGKDAGDDLAITVATVGLEPGCDRRKVESFEHDVLHGDPEGVIAARDIQHIRM